MDQDFTHVQSRDRVERHIEGDQLCPCVDEGGELLDGVVTHVDALKALQQIDRLGNCSTSVKTELAQHVYV